MDIRETYRDMIAELRDACASARGAATVAEHDKECARLIPLADDLESSDSRRQTPRDIARAINVVGQARELINASQMRLNDNQTIEAEYR